MVGALVAVGRSFFQAFHHHVIHLMGHGPRGTCAVAPCHFAWQRWAVVNDVLGHLNGVCAGECALPAHRFIEHSRHGKQIACGTVQSLGEGFGCGVAGGTQELAFLGKACVGNAGYSEIAKLDVAGFEHEQVVGFDVPVNDACPVGGVDGLGGLPCQLNHVFWAEGAPFADPMFEGCPGHVLHDQKRAQRLVFSHIEYLDDVGMLQTCSGPGFVFEAFQELRSRLVVRVCFCDQMAAQHLDGHRPIQFWVAPQVHVAHGAAAERAVDGVAANLVGGFHGSGWVNTATPCRRIVEPYCLEIFRRDPAFLGGLLV